VLEVKLHEAKAKITVRSIIIEFFFII